MITSFSKLFFLKYKKTLGIAHMIFHTYSSNLVFYIGCNPPERFRSYC